MQVSGLLHQAIKQCSAYETLVSLCFHLLRAVDEMHQIRVLETELSRAAAQRDLLRKVALSAEARQHSEEDKAKELEKRSKVMCSGLFRG